MAVYTKIDKKKFNIFLENYELGKLISFEEIEEGIENSNYKIITSSGSYIFTIFEKRINKNELPFFIYLKKHLANKKFLCPQPIKDIKGRFINNIQDKSCLICTFLKGKKASLITAEHCKQLGEQIAQMHESTNDFKLHRQNSLGQKSWKNIFQDIIENKNSKYTNLFKNISIEIDFLDKNWPKNLPIGIIHADVFQDNVFFL